MLHGRHDIPLTTLALLLCVATSHAQTSNASERTVVTITRDGLHQTTESSLRMPFDGATQSFSQAPESLRWSIASDGTWIAQALSLGDHGGLVFAEYGSFQNNAELFSAYDAGTPTAVWSDGQVQHNFAREVRSSSSGDVHIAVHQEYADANQVWRSAVLRKYSSTSSGVADWSYTSPLVTVNGDHTGSALSADGQTIALLAYNGASLSTQVTVFGPDSSLPVLDLSVPTFGQFIASELSADGSTLALTSGLKLVVVDLVSGALLNETFLVGQPQFGALALSGDGSLLAYGTLGEFKLLTRDESGVYSLSYSQALSMPTYCRRIELSEDGSTCVVGINRQGNANHARILSFDVATSSVLFDTTLSGSGQDLNLFEAIECSQDGARFAVGLWGDSDLTVPQVLVFRRDSFVPILVDLLPGSVNALDFSADGTQLAVASKGTHAMQWGGGGSFSLYNVGRTELGLSGIPQSGAVVNVEHRLREGSQSKILVATALAATPAEDLSIGAGLLYLDPASTWELPLTTAGVDSLASSALSLPGDAAAVGTSYYVQALDLDSGQLSKNWLQVTILP